MTSKSSVCPREQAQCTRSCRMRCGRQPGFAFTKEKPRCRTAVVRSQPRAKSLNALPKPRPQWPPCGGDPEIVRSHWLEVGDSHHTLTVTHLPTVRSSREDVGKLSEHESLYCSVAILRVRLVSNRGMVRLRSSIVADQVVFDFLQCSAKKPFGPTAKHSCPILPLVVISFGRSTLAAKLEFVVQLRLLGLQFVVLSFNSLLSTIICCLFVCTFPKPPALTTARQPQSSTPLRFHG